MAGFEYKSPPTLEDCFKTLRENPGAIVYAGGTDVMVKIRNGIMSPDLLVDIKGIKHLKGIKVDMDGTVWIGPLTTHSEIAESPIIREKYPFLADAARWVGSCQIRNRGTIGGNICNGSPAAETLPPLYVLNARLYLESADSQRIVSINNFCCGPQKTCLQRVELLTAIEILPVKGDYDGIYLRHARRNAVDIAMVTCAAFWHEDVGLPTGRRYRIALGAVAPTVVRAKNAEEFLNRLSYCSDDVIEEAAMTALKDVSPIDDIRTTHNYRNDITYVLIKRAIGEMVCRKGVSNK